MDFNFKKMVNDASATFNRAVQFTEEKLGKAERTELDAHFENLLARADKTEEHTRNLLACMEGYLQPNPTVRMEEFFYDKLELRKDHRMNNLEYLGQAMTDAGNEFGPGTPYGAALLKVGATQYKLGSTERELISTCAANSLTPIKRFLEGDMKTIARERKTLMNKRLDLDACKNRLRKAKSLENQANVDPQKQGVITVEQAEADLRVAQSEFDKQAEILKLLLEGIQTAHNNHLKCLRDFVEGQMTFYAQAHQVMAELQRELSGAGIHLHGISSNNQLIRRNSSGSGSFGGDVVPPSNQAVTNNNHTLTAATSLDINDMGTKQARVLFDYEAEVPQEITVKKDDVLIVYRLPGLDPDFVMAEKSGARGRVPLSYLEILT